MRSSGNSRKDDSTTIVEKSNVSLPRNILTAVSQIQQYYTFEKKGQRIPKEFLTLEGAIDYWWIGVKTTWSNGLFVALLSPILVAVLRDYIPVFGDTSPSLYDRIWAIFVTFSLTICFVIFLSVIMGYYIGDITKHTIKNLFYGIITGSIVKAVVVFFLYHGLYLFVLTETGTAKFLLYFKDFFSMATLQKWYYWINGVFKNTLIMASWIVVIDSAILVIVPLTFILVKARKVDKSLENKDKWGFGDE